MRRKSADIQLAATDLSNFLACRHLSNLDLAAAVSGTARPVRYGPVIEELRARGLAHEERYLAQLVDQGLSVARIGAAEAEGPPSVSALERTRKALASGVDIVYQATLEDDTWFGRADFLVKVPGPSALGDWSYEVVDTKLARDTRAGTILQLCVYSFLLERLQGVLPEYMHVVIPGDRFERQSYRLEDYSAYFRLLKRGIGDFVAGPAATYPELVSHCDLCAWWSECEARRRGDDHLCYVAGISHTQMKSLRQMGVNRLAELAGLDDVPRPAQGSREALIRVRDQARAQVKGREQEAPYYDLIEPLDGEHGLALLPEPTPDDIFLDFEGNHFAEAGVSEYLTGYLHRAANGARVYQPRWARTLEDEQRAFEQFIDLAIETRTRNPKAHIYHFAPYEPAALKRQVGRFATREAELDVLLRGHAFVDLHRIVRRAVIAGVERYSIKDLEVFFGYARKQSLSEASMSRRIVEQAVEAGDFDDAVQKHCEIVEAYNREDCESAERLRDWLEELRAEAVRKGHDLPRPEVGDGEASEAISELDQELQRLRDGLLTGVPIDPGERTKEQNARFVLAHMMEFHRREEKAAWWEFFRLRDLDPENYEGERRTLSGLTYAGVIEASRAPLQQYRFPAQELDARRGDDVYAVDGTKVGQVAEVNHEERTIGVKKMMATADVHPRDVFFHTQVSSKPLRESLIRLGDSVLSHGFSGQEPYRAGLNLLLRTPSSLIGGNRDLQQPGESTVEAACRLALQLDGEVLAVQGPPGTGKTFTGGKVICALTRAGLRVGVTAVSHKVIDNLLEDAKEQAERQGLELRAVHKQRGQYAGEWGIEYVDDYAAIHRKRAAGEIDVLGATAWCWARRDFEQSVDVLIVDEAGQMSLSNVLATCPAGRGLILLGDPQQLEQPLQSSHPEGSDVSALAHLLDGDETMPPDRGLFLNSTYRLHPEIARFTSEAYYAGRVTAQPGLERQAIIAVPGTTLEPSGSGLRFIEVAHEGNQAKSPEEVEVIRTLATSLLANGQWRDKHGHVMTLTERDILIVAPYNAQVAALAEALPELRQRIGTVDRFQGQEAPVVIYSMTSSSPEDAPRGMDFLYDPHRFNVATSRASALCVLVGSPALFEPECRTPRQMRRANGFCRYLELARVVPR